MLTMKTFSEMAVGCGADGCSPLPSESRMARGEPIGRPFQPGAGSSPRTSRVPYTRGGFFTSPANAAGRCREEGNSSVPAEPKTGRSSSLLRKPHRDATRANDYWFSLFPANLPSLAAPLDDRSLSKTTSTRDRAARRPIGVNGSTWSSGTANGNPRRRTSRCWPCEHNPCWATERGNGIDRVAGSVQKNQTGQRRENVKCAKAINSRAWAGESS